MVTTAGHIELQAAWASGPVSTFREENISCPDSRICDVSIIIKSHNCFSCPRRYQRHTDCPRTTVYKIVVSGSLRSKTALECHLPPQFKKNCQQSKRRFKSDHCSVYSRPMLNMATVSTQRSNGNANVSKTDPAAITSLTNENSWLCAFRGCHFAVTC
jgi:hypothetical protein